MKIPMLDLTRQHDVYRSELVAAANRVIDHGQFILGTEVSAFESLLSTYVNDAHVVGVSSGTDALLVALMALEVGAGAEVVLPAFSFFATAGVVARLGAKPVFVDICPKTFNADDQTIVWSSALNVFGQISTNTGLAPSLATTPAVAKKENAGKTTSAPAPTSSAINATRSASVPEETPTT